MKSVPLTTVEALLVTKIVNERDEALQAIREKEGRELAAILANYEVPRDRQIRFVPDENGMHLEYEEEVSQPSS